MFKPYKKELFYKFIIQARRQLYLLPKKTYPIVSGERCQEVHYSMNFIFTKKKFL